MRHRIFMNSIEGQVGFLFVCLLLIEASSECPWMYALNAQFLSK